MNPEEPGWLWNKVTGGSNQSGYDNSSEVRGRVVTGLMLWQPSDEEEAGMDSLQAQEEPALHV